MLIFLFCAFFFAVRFVSLRSLRLFSEPFSLITSALKVLSLGCLQHAANISHIVMTNQLSLLVNMLERTAVAERITSETHEYLCSLLTLLTLLLWQRMCYHILCVVRVCGVCVSVVIFPAVCLTFLALLLLLLLFVIVVVVVCCCCCFPL